MKYRKFGLIPLLFLCTYLCYGQEKVSPKTREVVSINIPKEKFHLYLLIGQSNMAGRGTVEPQDTLGNSRILRLNREGDWEIAKDPIHFDKSVAGVGPGLSFAREMLKTADKDIVIGLIPCAAGGSSIDIWLQDRFWEQTKSYPYNNTILRTKLALKDGILKGILWHQGEADSSPQKRELYAQKCIQLIKKIRYLFNCPDVPFIAGELPSFNKNAKDFNPRLYEIKQHTTNFDVVPGDAFTSLPDNVHLDAQSARELGKRYANKMKNINKYEK